MTMSVKNLRANTTADSSVARKDERGAALILAILIMFAMAVVTMGVLATVSTENRMAGSDLNRTQTFYAAAAGIEKMTNKFSDLFARTSRPSTAQLDAIRADYPSELTAEGFTFSQRLDPDDDRLADMRTEQGIVDGSFPRVTIPSGPFTGLIASVSPYLLRSTATKTNTGTQVALEREMNNYLIPLFQFGMFSNEDISLHPGPAFSFNGRVHANGNIYINGNVKFLAKVTTANELVRDVLRNNSARPGNVVSMQVNGINVPLTVGSVTNGPNVAGATVGKRGYFPDAPSGTFNTNWETTSVAAPRAGVANQFGGQLQTRTTGAAPLLLPLQLDGNPPREIIKRRMPNDNQTLSESRYHSKSQIRILIDDETQSATDASSIPKDAAGNKLGVLLSTFNPIPLPAGSTGSGGGRTLWRINDNKTYVAGSAIQQVPYSTVSGKTTTYLCSEHNKAQADTVRGIKAAPACSSNGVTIPAGAGITGRIMIQIVDANGVARDVTTQILSLGMTEGEPNSIISLQRPMWAAFTQGSRDSSGGNNYLTYLINSTTIGSDGQIKDNKDGVTPKLDPNGYGFLTNIQDDNSDRNASPDSAGNWNSIVPMNIYNVREGFIRSSLDSNAVYERGMMSVVEINMKNLARWVDGIYDTNLLANTPAVSANIMGQDGYILYVSDRRGDKVKTEKDSVGTLTTTNGMVDNEDIYGSNNQLDPGEDVIDAGLDCGPNVPKKGNLQRDLTELPEPAELAGTSGDNYNARIARAVTVAGWTNSANYFRRSVRLFDADNLQITGAAGKLSSTKGITVATENMIFIWGNYNTTGISSVPAGGATLVGGYNGNEVPSSIVADAFFPLSRTWFDSSSAMYPDLLTARPADKGVPNMANETSVRAGIIAGDTLGALAGTPDYGNGADSRLNGGIHNFPRFMEDWLSADRRWNFVGSFVPLYHSTQAMGQWAYPGTLVIYGAPIRNWAFDDTFKTPNRLPPGTPVFQYIEPTGFRQVL